MKAIIIIFLFAVSNALLAQPNRDYKRDRVWLFGYTVSQANPDFGNTIVDFNQNPPSVTSIGQQMNLDMQNAIMSDTLGQLIFYTNGQEVYNKNHQRMLNGIINLNDVWNLYFQNGQTQGLGLCQSALALPMPNYTNLYKLFYVQVNRLENIYIANKLLTATIDMNTNNHIGSVITKDVPIWQNDTLNGSTQTACRHANGRDWWILIHRYGLDTTYRFLLDPTGVHLKGKQHLQAHAPVDSCGESWYACFSPDGSKYAIYNALNIGVYLYNFDRCTGELSNRKILKSGQYNGGVAFSPNSRYLYYTDNYVVIQYDTDAPNINATRDTVGVRDTTVLSMGFYENYYGFPQLAPDGKIYMNMIGGSTYLHSINQPDIGGDACDTRMGTILLPHWTFRTMPNFPNFRLGALRGSPCDTLGIEEGVTVGVASPPPKEDFLRVYPNPAGSVLYIAAENIKGNVYLCNALGQQVKTAPIFNTLQINMYDLANGIYFLSVFDASGRRLGAQRVVVQHE
jgi:hypothetical protein